MDNTPNLALPYILAAQAQKPVTHNEALRALDVAVQLSVNDRDLTTPPASPNDGDRYLVAENATAAWAGQEGNIAAWQDNAWAIHTPKEGWILWVSDEDKALAFDGVIWVEFGGSGGSVNPTPLIGVNVTADVTNRLSVSSPATLLNHEGGGHQLKVNKNVSTDTASLLFQTDFDGRAEMGLAGDDDFHFKVSADGVNWKEAIQIDRSSGNVTFPFTSLGGNNPNLLINGDYTINQRGFSGGTLSAGDFGFDRWKAATGSADISLSGFIATLVSGEIEQIIEPSSWGYANLASTPLTLSVDTPDADMTVTIGSISGTITAGGGRQSVTLTTGSGDSGNLSVRLKSTAGGAVNFSRVKLEIGNAATNWQARPILTEQFLTKRYYQVFGNGIHGGGTQFSNAIFLSAVFPVAMRTAPTVSIGATTFVVRSRGVSNKTFANTYISDSSLSTTGFWISISGTPDIGVSQDESISLLTDIFNLDAEL